MASEELIHTLRGLANLHSKDFSEAGVELLIRVLDLYHEPDVLHAIHRCTIEINRFPTIAEIIERMPGEKALTSDQEATVIANRIIARIGLDGRTNPHRAREKIGEEGWKIVTAWGGWDMLCNTEISQLPSVRAQLEKLSKSILAQGSYLPAPGPAKLQANDQPQVEPPRSFAGLLAEIESKKDLT